jgi:P-type conjugative transfer ATPase TrbB
MNDGADVGAEAISGAARSHERLLEGLRRDLGRACLAALEDPSIKEVMLNPDGAVWFDQHGLGMYDAGVRMPASQAMKLMTTIASLLGTTITPDKPILQGELPLDGSRFQGFVPPLVKAPTFAIRKKAIQRFTMADYEKQGVLSLRHGDVLRRAIKERKNILVVGGTGSGKTTFLNALIDETTKATPQHRIVVIEDTSEVQCSAPNSVMLRSNERIDMTALLRGTLRLSPDRILCGEVRGGEALDLLEMWNTGHPGGLATVHADDAQEGLMRLQGLAYRGLQSGAGAEFIPRMVGQVVDIVTFIAKDAELAAGRRIKEVVSVERFDPESQAYVVTHF